MIAGKSVSSREIQHLELSNLNHQRARFRRPNHQVILAWGRKTQSYSRNLHCKPYRQTTGCHADRSNAHTERAQNGVAYWIKVSAQADGSFTVTNGPNGFSKSYQAH